MGQAKTATGRNWQRVFLLAIAVILMVVGFILAQTSVLDEGSKEFASGTMMKVGVVLGILWLAAPQLERFGWQRVRGTLLIGVIIVIVLWAIRPRIGAIAGAVLIASSLAFSIVGWVRRLSGPPRR